MTARELLHELGLRMGLGAIDFDEHTPCTLCFDGKYVVTLHHDPDDRALLLSAPVGGGEPRPEELRDLLTASCLGARTGGAAFGLSPETGELLLWKRHDDNLPDCAALETALNAFLAQLAHVQDSHAARGTTLAAGWSAPKTTNEDRNVEPLAYQAGMLRI